MESKKFIRILRDADISVELHRHHFVGNEKDRVWIPQVAERGWTIITADKNIMLRPYEKLAVVEAKARLLIVSMGKRGSDEKMATTIANTYPRIVERFNAQNAPLVLGLNLPSDEDILRGKSGRLTIRYPEQ